MARVVEQGWCEVDRGRLYYELDARGSGTPLLFAHGAALDRRMWRAQVEAFAGKRPCLAYDARGYGRSSTPEGPYRPYEDAVRLCEGLGLDRVIAVGHSVGAHRMLELAIAAPHLVGGLVSLCMSGLSAVPLPTEQRRWSAVLVRTALDQGIDAARPIHRASPWFDVGKDATGVAREIDQMLRDYSGWHWVNETSAIGLEPPAGARLAEVAVPSLIVTGGRDLPYNAAIAEALVNGIAGASRLHIEHAGHMANMEEPEVISDSLGAFAERCT